MDRAVVKIGDQANQPNQPNQPNQGQQARNEIEEYILARYISTGSAIWR